MYFHINKEEKIGEYRISNGDISIQQLEDFISGSKNKKANKFKIEIIDDPMHYSNSAPNRFTYLRAYRVKSEQEIKEEKIKLLEEELKKL